MNRKEEKAMLFAYIVITLTFISSQIPTQIIHRALIVLGFISMIYGIIGISKTATSEVYRWLS